MPNNKIKTRVTNKNKNSKCSICLNILRGTRFKTPCNHIFHKKCLADLNSTELSNMSYKYSGLYGSKWYYV